MNEAKLSTYNPHKGVNEGFIVEKRSMTNIHNTLAG